MTSFAPAVPFHPHLSSWPRGTVLNNRLGERLSREEIRRRILERAFREHSFMQQLTADTRVILAIVYDECLGLDRYRFLDTVLRYPVLFETSERLYMEMPTCHRGCTLPGALPASPEPRSECHICEKAFPLPTGTSFVMPHVRALDPLTRRSIEGHIQKRAAWDPGFAQALYADPLETYAAYASQLCSGRIPPYLAGVNELQLVHETGSEMYFIFPTPDSFALELDC